MFTSILDNTTDTVSFGTMIVCLAAALVLGLVVSTVYTMNSRRYTKNFAVTLVLLPALVSAIIFMTNGSLGSAVAVAGAFSLVRFRSAPGTSKEILAIFFVMSIGLACGMGEIAFAAVLTIVVSGCFTLLMKSAFGGTSADEKTLKVTIPEDLDYTGIFDDIFDRYTAKNSLDRVKTVGLGSMYELVYTITMKDEKQQKAMIDDIRTRNGNLSIVYGRVPESAQEL